MPEPMNVAEYIISALKREGVDTVFGYPGGAILPFYDALYGSDLRHILVRHEQAAAMAADAYARATGKVGVCVATSGPGATNLVTGIANAFLDSVPIVAITGQVPTSLLGTDAFQEVDIIGITMPIVKHSFLLSNADEVPGIISKAFEIARSGRPGPVLIDVPKDVALSPCDTAPARARSLVPPSPPCQKALALSGELIMKSRRPVIYAGGGIAIGDAVQEFREFVDHTGIPSVTTLKGIGCLPGIHPLNLGMVGMHGAKAANLAVQECDLLISIGARFDDRVTGDLNRFAPNAKVVHLDADPAEIGRRRISEAPVVGEMKASLKSMRCRPDIDEWRTHCLEQKDFFDYDYDREDDVIQGPVLLRRLSDRVPDATITCDVGQHQMWVAQHCRFNAPSQHLSSCGLGAMGYGMPAAIGARIGNPDGQVIAVCGDGSIMMNIQELATIRRYNLPIRILLLDNQRLGLVRQWQQLFLSSRYSETDLSDNPDFVRLAEACGIPAFSLDDPEKMNEAIETLVTAPGPMLLHVKIDSFANVWPIVPPGNANHEMLEEEEQ